jgi:K+/H+ antiporter YhaU regulatory subunit KhtT
VIILAVKGSEGAMTFNPAPEAVIHAGDCLIVIGGDDQLKKVEALASTS